MSTDQNNGDRPVSRQMLHEGRKALRSSCLLAADRDMPQAQIDEAITAIYRAMVLSDGGGKGLGNTSKPAAT
jgi:hypothetical protein